MKKRRNTWDDHDEDNDMKYPKKPRRKKPAKKAVDGLPLLLNPPTGLRKLFGVKDKPTEWGSGIKVVGQHVILVYSNNFVDREGEVFPAKGTDEFIARLDAKMVSMPELWLWHGGDKARMGETDVVMRDGHFTLALGHFDDTAAGQNARKYFSDPANAKAFACSHGFAYNERTFEKGVYSDYNTFEISLLPRGLEANRYTTIGGIKAMAKQALTAKRALFEKVLGKEAADEIFGDLTSIGKSLDALEIGSKDFGHIDEAEDNEELDVLGVKDLVDDPDDPEEDDEETDDPDDDDEAEDDEDEDTAPRGKALGLSTSVKAMMAELIAGQAEGLKQSVRTRRAVKAVADRMTALEQKQALADRRLRKELAGRPRSAAHDEQTLLTPERIARIEAAAKKQKTKIDSFTGLPVDEDE